MLKSKKIETLEKKLKETTDYWESTRDGLAEKLQAEYDKVFKKRLGTQIEIALRELDHSFEYCQHESGDIQNWVRANELLDLVPEDSREYFDNYLSNFGTYVDWENETLYSLDGGNFIINDDGDVYDSDSGKFIILKSEYDGCDERDSLIEKHMENTGYYPGVFSVDRHGNVFLVNTVGK